MCLLQFLIVLAIIGLLFIGRMPTPGELLAFAFVMAVAGAVFTFFRNRFADAFTTNFLLGGGSPARSSAEAFTDRADGYFAQQEYDTALYEYEQALRRARGPQRGPIMLRLAETAVLAGHPEEALRWWREAVKLKKGLSDEQRANALFRVADVIVRMGGDRRRAAQALDQVRREYPATKYATYAEARLHELARERDRA